jgi:3-hydroxyacyl-[acyl-carrier-protein] dehydratase
MLSKEKIKQIIPYDDPFLFVDKILEISDDEIIGEKQTSKDDYYFKGHFVDFPIMPGVLIVEGIAQTATLLLRKKIGEDHQKYHVLAYQVRGVQFKKPIFPGDKITYKVKLLGFYEGKIANFKGEALVENDLKCEARFTCAVVDKKEFEEKYSR